VGLAFAVAITGGIVLTIAAGAARTLSAPDRYTAAQGSDYAASIEQSGGQPRTTEVASLPAVARVRALTFVFGGLVRAGENPDRRLNALVFAGSHTAEGARLVEGRVPDARVPGEFVASRSFVESAHASIGDRFDLWVIPQAPAAALGYDAADQSVRLLRAELVGVVDGPSELQGGYAVAVFPRSLLDAGDVGISASQIVVSLRGGSTLHDLRNQLDGLPNGSQFGINPADWVPSVVRAAVRAQGQGLAILAVIAAAATIVVLGQLLSRQVRLSETERAVLHSMGMTRRQSVADPVLRAAVPTAVGALTAIALAFLASGVFPVGFVRHVEPDPGTRFESRVLLLTALALAVLVVAWVAVATVASDRRLRAGRAPVAEALARRVPTRVAIAVRFAFTHQNDESARPRAAVLGAASVVAVLVAALTFGVSLGRLIDRPTRWGNGFDLTLGQGGGDLSEDVRAQLVDDPDLSAVTLFANELTTAGGRGLNVTGARALRGSLAVPVLAGRLAARPDEIALGRVAARRLAVTVGDPLAVTGPTGRRVFHVTGLAVLPSVDGADGVGEGGLVTFAGLHRLNPSAGATAAGLRLRPGASDDAARRLSAGLGMAVGPGFDPPAVIVNVGRIRAIPFLVAALLGLLALMNLAHQLILSTSRRRRDLAVLRALGAGNRWLTGVVHWQASLFTIVVVAIAAPLGAIAGRVVYRAFVDRIGAVDTVTVPYALLTLVFVVLLALANMVAIPSAHRARRRPPSTVLAEE